MGNASPFGGDLVEVLNSHEVEHLGLIHYASGLEHVSIDVAYVIGAAGGLTGLAAALKAYYQRNRHNSVELFVRGKPVKFEGYSTDEVERLIAAALTADNDQLGDESPGSDACGR
jgi:hypothetical protein